MSVRHFHYGVFTFPYNDFLGRDCKGLARCLLCDGNDGISTGGQSIVTIVIGNSRQMKCAFLAASFKVVEDTVLVLEQRFLRIEQPRERVCRLNLQLCS